LKILVDTCVAPITVTRLREAGHDVLYAGDWKPDPGDSAILARAHAEKRVVLTIDKDFGELIFARGQGHAGLIRLVNLSVKQQSEVALQILQQYASDLERAAIITADAKQARIRTSG